MAASFDGVRFLEKEIGPSIRAVAPNNKDRD